MPTPTLDTATPLRTAELAAAWARYPISWAPHVSPDGRWLAWTWTGPDETGNVWIVPTDGTQPPVRLTDGSDHFYVRGFSKDGTQIVLAQSIGSSERDRLFLAKLPGRGKESHLTAAAALCPITALQDSYYVFGGCFSPDARTLYYTASMDPATGKAIEGQHILAHDLDSNEITSLAHGPSLDETGPRLSPDGRHLLYHRRDRHPAGCQVWLIDLDGQTATERNDREVLNFGDRVKTRAHWLTDDRLLVISETETHQRVGTYDFSAAAMNWLIDDASRDIDSVIPGESGKYAAVIGFDQGSLRATRLDVTTGAEIVFAEDAASLLPIAELPGGAWVMERYCSREVHDFLRVDLASGRRTDLSRSADQLAKPANGLTGSDFVPAARYRWEARDGLLIQGWLYRPRGKSRGLIAYIHGGPTWHSENWVNPIIQFLVGQGFTVLDPNYRGSTGYGRAFREAIKQQGWGGAEQLDIRAGIEHLIADGLAEPGRIGMIGTSYGGYSSWYGITKFADLVNAAMPICGMYHLTIDYDETGMPHGRAYSEEMMGGTPSQLPDRYYQASPANFLNQIKGRLLVVQGLRDTNVSPENAWAAFRDLQRAGIPYEDLLFCDEGHGVYKAGNRRQLLVTMERFFSAAFEAAT
ncbi:MAG TPA: prolyl oligopeptidase family serine peptidase [Terriglobia bacterium]|nr:prolyl oligopeptidase family serine peptidase [Terriglobia bacterium]